jgi:hypothetical protein
MTKKKEISILKDERVLKIRENLDALNSHFVSVAANVTSDLNSSFGCSTSLGYVDNDVVLTPTMMAKLRRLYRWLEKNNCCRVDGFKLSTIKVLH